MILKKLSIVNYKNIEEATLTFSPNVNCLIGNNGMGKTNVLDAIYYLSFCKSYINQGEAMVINHNADFMMLNAHYTRRGDELDVNVAMQRGKRKVVKRDGKEYKRLSQHIGLLPIVMVSPMDWDLIRGAGEERRRLMDLIISQSNAEYLAALIRYGQALESRNSLIRQGYRDPILFETVETQLCASATIVHQARAQWINEFSPIFLRYYQAISNSAESVRLEYKSHLNEMPLADHLARTRERDFTIGYTTTGVQRDDIELLLGDHSMRKTGSQGQCKTYTTALRLAQYDFLKSINTVKPILLLDDIFDKLDASRVENIINVVANNEFGQIFITDTNRTHLDEIVARIGGDYRLFNVEGGHITVLDSSMEGCTS